MYCGSSFLFKICHHGTDIVTANAKRCFIPVIKSIPQGQRSYHIWNSNNKRGLLDFGSKFNNSTANTTSRSVRCKRCKSTTLDLEQLPNQSSDFRKLGKPLAFTLLVCGGSFTGAMIYKYESMRKFAKRMSQGHQNSNSFFGSARKLPRGMSHNQISGFWNSLEPGRKLVAGIIMTNILVFGCWRIKALHPVFMKYFVSSAVKSTAVSSMLFSAFSHTHFFHLFVNMFVLWSFSYPVTHMFSTEELTAFYLSGGVIASLAGMIHKLVIRSPVPSLGASGALLAVLGAFCVASPDSQLQIALIGEIFPHSFSASTGCKAMIAFDLAGILFRWRLFDHAAHLGGMMFGLWYATYGHRLIWGNRDKVMALWHKCRGKPGNN